MTAHAIVAALGGRWFGGYGMARCVCHADGTNPALKIADDPRKSDGVDVHCFAGCDWRDIKRELARRGLLGELFPDAPRLKASRTNKEKSANAAHPNSAAAKALWHSSAPAKGTPVVTYLAARGITLIPPTLRYAPGAIHGPTGLPLPCMVAAVTVAPSRNVVAVHRTFLAIDGRGKAHVAEPRMMFGPCAGGAVRLAQAGDELAICEGIETGLSAMQVTGIPTWAALSTSGMRTVVLPNTVTRVVILADADPPGEDAAKALAARLVREGRKVRIARPPHGNDFNDSLMGRAPALGGAP